MKFLNVLSELSCRFEFLAFEAKCFLSLFKLNTVGSAIAMYTPATKKYSSLWRTADGESDIIFRVRTCTDAHIALSEMFGVVDSHAYEIIIGAKGNTK